MAGAGSGPLPSVDEYARIKLLERFRRRGLESSDLKLTDSGHDFVVSLDLMRRLQPRAEGKEVRHDQLTALEALLLRAIFDYADAYSDFPDDVLAILADQEWSDADSAQLERLLEEERADRQ